MTAAPLKGGGGGGGGGKGLFGLYILDHRLLKRARVGIQTGQELETKVVVEVMEECCLLECSHGLLNLLS